MRVLLIQTPQIVRDVISLSGIEIPLNLTYIASALERPLETIDAYQGRVDDRTSQFALQMSVQVDILDLQFYKDPWSILQRKIASVKPDIVGITAFTIQANFVEMIAKIAKQIRSSTLTVFGGVHASALPEQSLREMPSVDIIARGEGEITLLEICARYSDLKEDTSSQQIHSVYKDTQGLAIRDADGRPILNPSRPLIKNLDKLPFPAREKLDIRRYAPLFVNYMHLPSTGIITSRGCPFQCTFCSKAVFQRTLRRRTPSNVVDEMQYCEKKYGIKDFRFFDDVLTINKKWLIEFCKILLERKCAYTWNALSRVSDVSEPLLRLMKRAGCYHIKYGVESGSQKILTAIKKNATLEQARNAIAATNRVGIESLAYYIVDFPGESLASMWNTIRFARCLNSTYAMFQHLTPIPGSAIYEQSKQEDNLIHEHWECYGEEDPPVLKNQTNLGTVQGILRQAYNRYYIRPMYVLGLIRFIALNFSPSQLQRLLQGLKTMIPSKKPPPAKE
jgi:anaerobic magnesium-protoporphyrin IX monomethyl ester cyclase